MCNLNATHRKGPALIQSSLCRHLLQDLHQAIYYGMVNEEWSMGGLAACINGGLWSLLSRLKAWPTMASMQGPAYKGHDHMGPAWASCLYTNCPRMPASSSFVILS